MSNPRLAGVVTPILTPFEHSGAIAEDLYHAHAARLLADGSHYLSPFGTTGEATSVPVAARMVALERLVESGTARPDQLLPGTGLTSLADTIFLTRHAVELGVKGVMVLPPFFYAEAGDEGLYRYFATLIEDIRSEALRIILYHIPQNTGVGISAALTRRLALDFPGYIAGYKDSSGVWSNTVSVIRAAPDISVFPGSETFLPQAMAAGGAGCISATCNVNVRQIRHVYDLLAQGMGPEAADPMLEIKYVRESVARVGLIRGLKSLMARRMDDPRWLHTLPPLLDAPTELTRELEAVLLETA